MHQLGRLTGDGQIGADLYVEETRPDHPTEYRVGDRWEKMTVVREQVALKGEKAPAEVELRFTRHGPVLHQDEPRRRAYALKWVGGEPGSAAYLGSLAVDRAGSWPEFLRALESWKSPGENMVYADVEGNIGWVAAGLMLTQATRWLRELPIDADVTLNLLSMELAVAAAAA